MNDLLERAAMICLQVHSGAVDKAGKAYFLHPLRVAMACATDEQRIVAMLHDTIEDTEVTPEGLLEYGFPQEIVNAVLSVTRQDGETYEQFVERCALNPIGRQVKLRDLEDNMNLLRLDSVNEKSIDRLNRYIKAHRFLSDYVPALTAQSEEEEAELGVKPVARETRVVSSEELARLKAQAQEDAQNANRLVPFDPHHRAAGGSNYMQDNIRVMFNGKTYFNDAAIDNFVDVIDAIGWERIAELEIKCFDTYWRNYKKLIVPKSKSKAYVKGRGAYFIFSTMSNADKYDILKDIAKRLNLDLLVDFVPKP